jgi:hypothetical protein
LIKNCTQANNRGVFLNKRTFFQVFRQITEHFSLCITIAAKGVQSFDFAEKISGHFQLPWGEKTGMGRDIPVHSAIDFVPKFGQEHSVVATLCNFIDILSVHLITKAYYITSFLICKDSFA